MPEVLLDTTLHGTLKRMARSTPSRSPAASKRTAAVLQETRLREVREQRGLSRDKLSELTGMHPNSIYKLEKGMSQEVTEEHANALAAALKVSVNELGLRVRSAAGAPRSVKFRRLTPAQREVIDEILALPEEAYAKLREAIELLRASQRPKRRRKS